MDKAIVSDEASHLGEVVAIDGENVKVLIESASACSSCHLKRACSSADVKDKLVEVCVDDASAFHVGERVSVFCSTSQGFYALFWAYIVPLILVVACLFVGFSVWENELKAGLFSLAILLPYYLFLYLARHYFKEKMNIKINKITA